MPVRKSCCPLCSHNATNAVVLATAAGHACTVMSQHIYYRVATVAALVLLLAGQCPPLAAAEEPLAPLSEGEPPASPQASFTAAN